MASSSIINLTPGIQDYAWGKKGSSSLAAQLAAVSVPDFEIDKDKTYAELWMGTHPNVPSKIDASTTLSEHLAANPLLIGEKVAAAFPDCQDGSLPFLFKILSIGTALSIQAHPGKSLAERLHKERPDVYKDPNHKPEMAIALTPFLAFLNFLPLQTLLLNLLSVPELDSLVDSSLTSELATSLTLPDTRPPTALLFEPTISPPTDDQKAILKKIFAALMSADPELVKKSIESLVGRYQAHKSGEESATVSEAEKGLVDLALMLNEQYPGDVGVLCVFVLNVVELKRGEAAFLGADMPHAYISGDIIECMATSDNVVRAGLTPKLRDVPTLVEMLTYEAGPGSKQLLKPTTFGDGDDKSSLLYDPPIAEFSVLRVELEEGKSTTNRVIDGPSICVVTEGKGSVGCGDEKVDFGKGSVFFLAAGKEITFEAGDKIELFRAFVEAPAA